MATGDTGDFVARLQGVLPARWFPVGGPLITAVLTGLASTLSIIYSQIACVITQSRVGTATDVWLDGISQDFNNGALPRLIAEGDTAFRARIKANFFAPQTTRAGISQAVTALGCPTPVYFQPSDGKRTQAATASPLATALLERTADITLPFSYFITVRRKPGGGIAGVNGYAGTIGGYGAGAVEYADLSMIAGEVTDQNIQNAVAGATAEGVTPWLNITN